MSEEVNPLSPDEINSFNEALRGYLVDHDEQRLEELFRLFDRNSNGELSSGEIRTVMEQISGHGFSNEQIDNLVAQVDANGDGVIDIREFIRVMHRFTD